MQYASTNVNSARAPAAEQQVIMTNQLYGALPSPLPSGSSLTFIANSADTAVIKAMLVVKVVRTMSNRIS